MTDDKGTPDSHPPCKTRGPGTLDNGTGTGLRNGDRWKCMSCGRWFQFRGKNWHGIETPSPEHTA
jgi:hypothetical protein